MFVKLHHIKRTNVKKIFNVIILAALLSVLVACHNSVELSAPNNLWVVTDDIIEITHAAETTSPPAEGTSPKLSGGVLLPNGALPDGEYSPQFSQPGRYYPETVHGLIASPGYGRIWPYIGEVLTGMWMDYWCLIGICDADGRIICDPYYNDVEIIEHGEQRLYAFIKNQRGTGVRYYDLYTYSEAAVDIYETTLCPLDGSWAETYDSLIYREDQYVSEASTSDKFPDHYGWYTWRPAVKYEYITAERDGKWGVLDWDGKVLLPFIYPEPVCFHEGLACILSDDGLTVSFIDIKGETVLGPYEAPPRQPRSDTDYSGDPLLITKNILFYEGLARFYSNGKYGMIDTAGRVIVPAIYEYVTSFTGGKAMTVSTGGENGSPLFGIVNTGGAMIAESLKDTPYISDGKVIINYDWNTYHCTAINSDGKLEEYDVRTPSWTSINGNIITYADGHTLTIPDVARLERFGDRFIAYYGEWGSAGGTWRLYDGNGNALSEAQPGRGRQWQRQVNDNGTEYIYMFNTYSGMYYSLLLLYDIDGNPVLRNAYWEIIPIDGYFMVADGKWAGLIDGNENYIIKVSIIPFRSD